MHLELMPERSRDFPDVLAPDAVTTARVWHCKYRSLAPVSRLTRLEGLVIATYPERRGVGPSARRLPTLGHGRVGVDER